MDGWHDETDSPHKPPRDRLLQPPTRIRDVCPEPEECRQAHREPVQFQEAFDAQDSVRGSESRARGMWPWRRRVASGNSLQVRSHISAFRDALSLKPRAIHHFHLSLITVHDAPDC